MILIFNGSRRFLTEINGFQLIRYQIQIRKRKNQSKKSATFTIMKQTRITFQIKLLVALYKNVEFIVIKLKQHHKKEAAYNHVERSFYIPNS